MKIFNFRNFNNMIAENDKMIRYVISRIAMKQK